MHREELEKYCDELLRRIVALEEDSVTKQGMRIDLPLPPHRATITVSLVEAVQAILNYLDLHLERTPEVIAVKKKK